MQVILLSLELFSHIHFPFFFKSCSIFLHTLEVVDWETPRTIFSTIGKHFGSPKAFDAEAEAAEAELEQLWQHMKHKIEAP